MVGFGRKRLLVLIIGNINFSLYNAVERYDTVLLQEFQTFFLKKL